MSFKINCQYFFVLFFWWLPWDIYNLLPQIPFHRYLGKIIYKLTLIQHLIQQCKGQIYFKESLGNFTRDEISRDTDYLAKVQKQYLMNYF